MLKERIDQDLKTALLSGDKVVVSTLRGLKSVILYEEVDRGVRAVGLGDEDILPLLVKEAKKRQESADLYSKGGNQDRAGAELAEKEIIERYLPEQLSEEALTAIVDQAIKELGVSGLQALGSVIGMVKQKASGQAEGSRIAAIAKKRLG